MPVGGTPPPPGDPELLEAPKALNKFFGLNRLAPKAPEKILLPSAVHLEERLTVSQSVSWSGKQSVTQSVGQTGRQTETHSLGFFSGRLGYKQRGDKQLSEHAMVYR